MLKRQGFNVRKHKVIFLITDYFTVDFMLESGKIKQCDYCELLRKNQAKRRVVHTHQGVKFASRSRGNFDKDYFQAVLRSDSGECRYRSAGDSIASGSVATYQKAHYHLLQGANPC